MSAWKPYSLTPNTVVGDLRVWERLYSPQLDNDRNVFVWLPPGYDLDTAHYPVIYMHDGQNLFDAHHSHSGEWQVDETMTTLANDGLPAIIVGLPNMNEMRGIEYSPYDFTMQDQRHSGRGDAYIGFVTETVKPLIDSHFRTRPEPAFTGIAGSSMGGLISLHGFLTRRDVFGLCGAFSTAYWFGENALLQTAVRLADGTGRVYLDVGTREGETLTWFFPNLPPVDLDMAYVDGVRALRDALLTAGYAEGDQFMYLEEEGAPHHESAWARRLPAAMRFLLASTRKDAEHTL
ncbi:MAG: alpha/beta hydrolase-fold protein [bacterium]|nr:alpha/beta hydrolase-fold protein [bacterium]